MEKIKNTYKNNNKYIVFGLFGAGGFSREVIPLVKESIILTKKNINPENIKIFLIDQNKKPNLNGYEIISEQDFFEIKCNEKLFNIAISDSKDRERIAKKCILNGVKPTSVRSPHSVSYDCNEIGDGAILCAHTMITSNAKIGKFFHSNIYSYVAHDCVIGDYVTFAPNVHCNGNVHIHNHAYIGTGAIIKEGSLSNPLVIGEGSVIGMGAVVTKNVPPFTTVVGNPAKPFNKI